MAARHGELVTAAVRYCTALGHYVFPVPNRGVKIKNKRTGESRWIRGKVRPGVADVCGLTAYGRFLAIEVKVSPDRLSPEQARFKVEVERRGGLFVEVRDNVQALIDLHKGGMI
jgi:hypothetical protein